MKKYLIITRIILMTFFILCSLHFINTWLYFIVNPFIDEKLISFTWLGLAVNFLELSYCIWFIEYYIENSKEKHNYEKNKKRP